MRAAICVVLISSIAVAEDERPVALVLVNPSQITVDTGNGISTLDLPPGIFLPQSSADALDTELKRMQAAEADLRRQNKDLGEMLAQGPSGASIGAMVTVAIISLLVGAGVGAAVAVKK